MRRRREPRGNDRARVYDDITSPPAAAIGITLGAYAGIADDEHNWCNVPSAFDMSPERIVKTRADGGMQDVREVLEEHNLPTSRRKYRRVRARARQERRKGI
jgi:hypothetical protein